MSAGEDLQVVPTLAGRPGGRFVYGLRAEPKTLNPLFAVDSYSRDVINRLMADLVHINRLTLKTEPALAKSCAISQDGLHYQLELRHGVKFSNGDPFDADDVVFTFQVYLDGKLNSPQRSLWVLDGKPIIVRKLGSHRVVFDLPRVNAVGERIFDGVPMLPRKLLESAYHEGRLKEAWGLRTPPAQIAGLGPYRLKEYVPGQRVVLERNPYYWKADAAHNRLPYLDELAFTFDTGEEMQVLRFQSRESDAVSRVSPKNYQTLARNSDRRGQVLRDAGAGFEYSFLCFNLNDSARQRVWSRLAFRRAVAAAIDRDAMVRLIYLGFGEALASPVAAGNRNWIDAGLPRAGCSASKAREILAADGFKWSAGGALLDVSGNPVRISIIASSTNPDRLQMATLIQSDLKLVGIAVDIVPLEQRSLVDRVVRTHEYDAAILALASQDADPKADMTFWCSSGGQHVWNPEQKTPSTPWEAEIDRVMQKQLTSVRYADRKRLFDRAQELVSENVPVIPLVTPHVLVGAKRELGNFQPALLEPYAIWNIEELYWQTSAPGRRQ